MYKVAVTNRQLCKDDFFEKIKSLSDFDMVILREKDLTENEYLNLAEKVVNLHKNIVLHTFINVAKQLNISKIHLPFEVFKNNDISDFSLVGVSIHSLNEAIFAEQNGANYLIYGHIFQTDCKKGLAPRGLVELEKICKSVNIPVYAIGGIDKSNQSLVEISGAMGICQMKSAMQAKGLQCTM